jgi:hypothetical protein
VTRSDHRLAGWGAVAPAHRAVLWKVMPLAAVLLIGLSVAERIWWRPPSPPPAAQIDTSLTSIRGPEPTGEAVRVEPEPEPLVAVDDEPDVATSGVAARLSADRSALAQVRDDTVFREADLDAWLQTWQTIREAGASGLTGAAAPEVSFAELFHQPRSFRGRLVRLSGTLHRLERLRAPANNYGVDHYWQGWLEPAGGPASPIVVQCLELPEGMPVGLKIHEPVELKGYFFKRYAYPATDTVRVAPLVMALEPAWRPPPPSPSGGSFPTWGLVPVAAAIVGLGAALGAAGRIRQRRRELPAVDVAAALAGFEPETTAESLRRLAADEPATGLRGRAEAPGPRSTSA